jgi:adenosylmethionine-8-amino-7-oxononanoate aminotransferase
VSDEVFKPFFTSQSEATLYYGHSYSGNALGCAAALASLELFRTEKTIESLPPKIETLRKGLSAITELQGVERARTCGMIGAVDLAGESGRALKVCRAARERGLLTRHIRNTVVLMPPLIISVAQIKQMLSVLTESIRMYFTLEPNIER